MTQSVQIKILNVTNEKTKTLYSKIPIKIVAKVSRINLMTWKNNQL